MLSFLPLAHAYGCAFDFLTATAVGTHVTLLGKVPSPKIIMKAFEEVKPNLIITVPLVIEKIYKNVIQPIISKKGMKWALSIPLLDNQIYGQIRKSYRCAWRTLQRNHYRWSRHEPGSRRVFPQNSSSPSPLATA